METSGEVKAFDAAYSCLFMPSFREVGLEYVLVRKSIIEKRTASG